MAQTANIGRFVGRRDQLSLLRQAYDRAASGDGRIVFISGEAGAGEAGSSSSSAKGSGSSRGRAWPGNALNTLSHRSPRSSRSSRLSSSTIRVCSSPRPRFEGRFRTLCRSCSTKRPVPPTPKPTNSVNSAPSPKR